MSAGWVAGSVRAMAMLDRRIGADRAHVVAACDSLSDAQLALADSPYRHDVMVGQTLSESEHALAAGLLWRLRVLSGWQPPVGAGAIRLLAAGFEIANVDDHARVLTAGAQTRTSDPPFELGSLGIAWSRVRTTTSITRLRAALATSIWGDPGSDRPADIATAIRLVWARRIIAAVADAARWAAGGAALLVARRLFVERAPLSETAHRHGVAILGPVALTAPDLAAFGAALPSDARWALTDVTAADQLWRAEFRWWSRFERDGMALVAGSRFGAATPIGVVALLTVDAWRLRAALQISGSGTAWEADDALV